METPKPLPPAADRDELKTQLDELETKLLREVIAVGLTKPAAGPGGTNVAQVLDADSETKKLKRLTIEEVPVAAQADPEAFRGFVAPLLQNAELVDRTVVLFGTTETQVVILRELPDLAPPPGDGTLRGDGTWPWFATIEGEDIVVSGAKATAFGGDDDPQDSGETASGVHTKGNPGLEGCSLPMRYSGLNEKLLAALGGSPIPRMPFGLLPNGSTNPTGIRVRVTDPANGTSIEVPVIDVGPAKKTGHALDLTVASARRFQAGASARNFSKTLDFRILKGARFADRPALTISPAAAGFAARLTASAEGEFDLVRQTHETAPPMRQRIETYWTGLGLAFPGVSVAWSAVFISWNVLTAGAVKANFTFSARHSEFVHDAIVGKNVPPAFTGRRIGDYAPKVGDIIQNNRGGNSFSFDFARANDAYESHSAIVVEVGAATGGQRFAVTIGGNENDSVRRRRIDLDSAGKIIQPSADFYICVLENKMA